MTLWASSEPRDTRSDEVDVAEVEDESDTFPWVDAARWRPTAMADDDPYGDTLEYVDDGAVIVCDPLRPWVATLYEPPWWAEEGVTTLCKPVAVSGFQLARRLASGCVRARPLRPPRRCGGPHGLQCPSAT